MQELCRICLAPISVFDRFENSSRFASGFGNRGSSGLDLSEKVGGGVGGCVRIFYGRPGERTNRLPAASVRLVCYTEQAVDSNDYILEYQSADHL